MYQDIIAHQARIAELRAQAEQERLVAFVRRRQRDAAREQEATRRRARWAKAA
ncbi:hypothetical protein V1J52_03955 [Streptomyces sp. TRM 70351]|uniref:hypothetical protein n=1 Tax=Streptomyces sp. TRM 70351 TaxID=3116552 RepID=UPI002E7C152E|nr:hypothetical protein [Streptomyces sp. TRM 70351]MEE1927343.1 hypothetical protein [Streptomyces sp. TRM 70351]